MDKTASIVIITSLLYIITRLYEVNQVDKKVKEQQRALAEKVALLSDSDIAVVHSIVEQAVDDEQRTIGQKRSTEPENTTPEHNE